MAKTTISTRAKPSRKPLLCVHCQKTYSPMPVCGPCQRAFIREQIKLLPPSAYDPIERAVAKVAAAALKETTE